MERLTSEVNNFAVVLKEEEWLIGNASIFDVQHIHQCAEIGLFIGQAKDRGKGMVKKS